jgi:hypothetical protein
MPATSAPAKTPRKRQKAVAGDTAESAAATPKPKRGRKPKAAGERAAKGRHSPGDEDWELDCEICMLRGKNLVRLAPALFKHPLTWAFFFFARQDEETGLVSCGRCSKWQHIKCYDASDKDTGRARRDWEKEEFMCTRCRAYTAVPVSLPPSGGAPSRASAVGVQAYGAAPQPQAGAAPGITYQHYQPGTRGGFLPVHTPCANGAPNALQNGHYAPAPVGWPGPAAFPPPSSHPSLGFTAGVHPGLSAGVHPTLQAFGAAPHTQHPSLPPMSLGLGLSMQHPALPSLANVNGFGGGGAYGVPAGSYAQGYPYEQSPSRGG